MGMRPVNAGLVAQRDGPSLLLFEGEFEPGSGTGAAPYDISPDGERFAFLRVSREPVPSLHIILNWFEELRRLVPTSR